MRIERMIASGTPFRRVSEIMKQERNSISYGAVFRHTQHTPAVRKGRRGEIDDFVGSTRKFRPIAIGVNVDMKIRRALIRKRSALQNSLKKSGYRRRATMSSVVNYFLEKGARLIVSDKVEADKALHDHIRQRGSLINSRKRRIRGQPLSAMISNELDHELKIHVEGSVWANRPFEELRKLWDETVSAICKVETRRPLPVPSYTDYVNLALKAGLEAPSQGAQEDGLKPLY